MSLSKYGVCYDLEKTPYKVVRENLTFHFSSERHREKFLKDVGSRERGVSASLYRRFKFLVDASIIADFQLYVLVESRGFYVVCNDTGRILTCLSQVQLGGLEIR